MNQNRFISIAIYQFIIKFLIYKPCIESYHVENTTRPHADMCLLCYFTEWDPHISDMQTICTNFGLIDRADEINTEIDRYTHTQKEQTTATAMAMATGRTNMLNENKRIKYVCGTDQLEIFLKMLLLFLWTRFLLLHLVRTNFLFSI